MKMPSYPGRTPAVDPPPPFTDPPVPPTHRSGAIWVLLALLVIALSGWYWLGQRPFSVPVAPPLPDTPVDIPSASTVAAPDRSSVWTRQPPPVGSAAPARSNSSPAVPIPRYRTTPTYPVAALRAGESGTVVLRVPVGIGGMPGEIDFARRSGSLELDNAARDAVRQWRFEPALRKGKPVTSVMEIPIDFEPPR